MRFIRCLIALALVFAIALLGILCGIAIRGYRIVSIAETVVQNHLVEKGNGAAWPVKITALMGEITKTSDSVRVSADTVKDLLKDEAPSTARALRTSANELSALIAKEGPATAASVRDAAAGLAGTSRTVQSILSNDGPATAKSVRDAAASLAAVADTVQTIVQGEGPSTAKSIREAANTAQKLLSEEGPPTAAAIRKLTESGSEFAGYWADISEALKGWVDRLTAPPTVKAKIWAVIHAVIIALAHSV